MIEKKIRALHDAELKTCFGFHFLVKGEVKRIQFKNQSAFDELLKVGKIVEADRSEEESKNIPVILPEVSEDTIVEVEPKEESTVEELEEVLTGPEVHIDVMSDGSIQPKGMDPPEDSPTVHSIESIVNIPMVGQRIEETSGDTEVLPEEQSDEAFEIEEPPTIQEAGALSEIEEIPIEDRDESKPELKPGEVVDE